MIDKMISRADAQLQKGFHIMKTIQIARIVLADDSLIVELTFTPFESKPFHITRKVICDDSSLVTLKFDDMKKAYRHLSELISDSKSVLI